MKFAQPVQSPVPIPSSAFDTRFEIRFEMLANPGRAVVFPCDSGGKIVEEALSPRARSNLVRVSELVGRDYAYPVLTRTSST